MPSHSKGVMDELAGVVTWRSNGVANDTDYVGSLAVLRNTRMPALLTETGFMDVWEQARMMLDPDFVNREAEATCRGICRHLGVTYVEPPGTEPAPGPDVPSGWAKEGWDWALAAGLTDGTNPRGNMTR